MRVCERLAQDVAKNKGCMMDPKSQPALGYDPGCYFISCGEKCKCARNFSGVDADGAKKLLAVDIHEWQQTYQPHLFRKK